MRRDRLGIAGRRGNFDTLRAPLRPRLRSGPAAEGDSHDPPVRLVLGALRRRSASSAAKGAPTSSDLAVRPAGGWEQSTAAGEIDVERRSVGQRQHHGQGEAQRRRGLAGSPSPDHRSGVCDRLSGWQRGRVTAAFGPALTGIRSAMEFEVIKDADGAYDHYGATTRSLSRRLASCWSPWRGAGGGTSTARPAGCASRRTPRRTSGNGATV